MPRTEENTVRRTEAEERRGKSPAAQRVLEAASELFYERGIWATGVDTIVEHSGVTKMTLYKHFGSKDELVAAYLRRRDELWRRWLTEAVEQGADSPRERLLAVFDALGGWLEGEVEGFRGCAFVNAATEIAAPDHPARAVALEQKRWMREYLEELASDAGATDPEGLAEQLLILFEGATVTTTLQASKAPTHGAKVAAATLIDGDVHNEDRN
ncbi:TetR/AcrR family transcriptional regulator [soil metagenome]|jgi:AcrR family transcriptional regulator